MADKPASAWFGAGSMGWPMARLCERLGSTQLGGADTQVAVPV
jgi:hypothetical protein